MSFNMGLGEPMGENKGFIIEVSDTTEKYEKEFKYKSFDLFKNVFFCPSWAVMCITTIE